MALFLCFYYYVSINSVLICYLVSLYIVLDFKSFGTRYGTNKEIAQNQLKCPPGAVPVAGGDAKHSWQWAGLEQLGRQQTVALTRGDGSRRTRKWQVQGNSWRDTRHPPSSRKNFPESAGGQSFLMGGLLWSQMNGGIGFTHNYCLDRFILNLKLGWPKVTKVTYKWRKRSFRMNFEGNSVTCYKD